MELFLLPTADFKRWLSSFPCSSLLSLEIVSQMHAFAQALHSGGSRLKCLGQEFGLDPEDNGDLWRVLCWVRVASSGFYFRTVPRSTEKWTLSQWTGREGSADGYEGRKKTGVTDREKDRCDSALVGGQGESIAQIPSSWGLGQDGAVERCWLGGSKQIWFPQCPPS